MGRERLDAEREADRVYRRELARVCLECIGCCVVGLVPMAFALHSTDRGFGLILWWGGMLLGYAGITVSLATAYLRGEKRGDW